jgi:Kef-type K+ transport system membrane component KefB
MLTSVSIAAPIPAHQVLVLLLELALLLTCAVALGRLARRFGLPPVVGELSAGVLIGPSILGQLAPGLSDWLIPQDASQLHLLDAVGFVGVVLLVAFGGMEINVRVVRRWVGSAALISGSGFLLPLALGIGAGLLLPITLLGGTDPDRTVFALFLGVAMCVSAIPVMIKTLLDMNLMRRRVGILALTAGVIDDTFGWVLLSVIAAMATAGVRPGTVITSVAWILTILAFCVLIGGRLFRTLLTAAERSGPGTTIATAFVLVISSAAATQAMGLEAILGAFAAGVLIGNVPGMSAHLQPLGTVVMGVLAPIFFATAGLRIDLTALSDPAILGSAVIVIVIAIVGKFVGAYFGSRLSGLRPWEAIAIGAGMNARGVIEVVIAMVGVRLGVLSTAGYTIIVLVAIVTSVMAPPILRFAMLRVDRDGATDEESEPFTERADASVAGVG